MKKLFFLYVWLNLTRIAELQPVPNSIRDKENLVKHMRKRTIQTGRLFFSSSLIVVLFIQVTVQAQSDNNPSCSDLVIGAIELLEIQEKCLILQYTVYNQGAAPANLFGAKRKRTDNTVVRAYFSGDEQLNRSDIAAGATFIYEKDVPNNGLLHNGEYYTGIIELDRRKQSNYLAIILLQVDALDTLRECDETNNVGWMVFD